MTFHTAGLEMSHSTHAPSQKFMDGIFWLTKAIREVHSAWERVMTTVGRAWSWRARL